MVCGANAAVFVLCGSLVVSAEQAQDQIAGTSLFCGIFRVSLCADCIFPRSHSSITPLVKGCVLYIMLMQHDLQRCRAPATLRAVWLTRCADVAQAQDVCRGLFSNVVLAVGYFAWRPRTSVGIICSMLGGDRVLWRVFFCLGWMHFGPPFCIGAAAISCIC